MLLHLDFPSWWTPPKCTNLLVAVVLTCMQHKARSQPSYHRSLLRNSLQKNPPPPTYQKSMFLRIFSIVLHLTASSTHPFFRSVVAQPKRRLQRPPLHEPVDEGAEALRKELEQQIRELQKKVLRGGGNDQRAVHVRSPSEQGRVQKSDPAKKQRIRRREEASPSGRKVDSTIVYLYRILYSLQTLITLVGGSIHTTISGF